MVIDAGRIKHLGDLMHKSIASNGSAVSSNWRLSADGLTNVVWTPESAAASYGSNSNEVSYVNAPGASSLVSRTDHVHRGVTSISHTSNTLFGPITLTPEGQVGITVVGQTIKLNVAGAGGGGGGGGSVTFSGCKAYHSTTQTLTTATVTAALLDSEEFDTDGYHSTATNTSRMTIPAGKDGYFLLAGKVIFAANATGVRIARFLKNGTTILRTQYSDAGVAGAGRSAQITAVASLVATDYVEFTVYQTSGGNLNIGNAAANEENTSFELVRLGT